jgi:GT2 family glycosyltransferase
MTGSILKASVILCAYTLRRWDDLLEAVDSIRHQDTPAGEIILVIDHNQELYQKAVAQFPDVQVLENQGARGLSGARNSGIKIASQPVVAFMDEDATAQRDWLTRLLGNYQDESVIGVGGTVEPNWLEGQPGWFPDEFTWVVGCTYKGQPEAIEPVRNILGCNMSFRREIFDLVGGFRDSLGRLGGNQLLSCEETEFCIRANRRFPHSQIVYEPMARVIHKVPANRSTWHYYWMRCYAEGLSKSLVTAYTGAGVGLASERKYTFKTLPSGILRGFKDSFSEGNPSGLLRANAITAGLAITALGFLKGQLTLRSKPVDASLLKAS